MGSAQPSQYRTISGLRPPRGPTVSIEYSVVARPHRGQLIAVGPGGSRPGSGPNGSTPRASLGDSHRYSTSVCTPNAEDPDRQQRSGGGLSMQTPAVLSEQRLCLINRTGPTHPPAIRALHAALPDSGSGSPHEKLHRSIPGP